MKKTIAVLILVSFFSPVFTSGSELTQPQDLQEAKEIGEKAAKFTWRKLPSAIKKVWQEEVIPFYQKAWDFIKNPWDSYIQPGVDKIWLKIKSLLGFQIDNGGIKEEFKKETEEMKKDLPQTGRSIWQKFKEIIK